MPQDVVGTGDTPNTGRGKWNNDIGELFGDIADHITDASDSHDASSVSFTPAGGLTSTNAQSAIVEAAGMGGGSSDAAWNPVRVVDDSGVTLSGTPTVDGVALSAGNRVLRAGGSADTRGIYVVAAGAWSRATDADASEDFLQGKTVYVNEGTEHGGQIWALETSGTVIVDTTSLSFVFAPTYATETRWGLARIATQSEVNAGDSGLDVEALVNPFTLAGRTATSTRTGLVELATDAETQTGTDTARAITPANLSARTGTETRGGVLELATDAETQTGTDTARAITPANLSARSATETRTGVAELATQTETDTGTDDARIVTALKAATRYLAKAGGTLTGFLSLHADPSSAMHAVTKQYADALVVGGASPASETVAGIAEIATQTETDTGTDDARIVTPLKLATRTATDTRSGVVELATDAETQTGTDTARAITPANLSARSATETRSGIAEVATQAETNTGTDDARMVTPLKLANYSGLGGGSSYRTLVTLGSDVANATTSYADVTGLSFAVSSGTTYRFEFHIYYDASAATIGSRWAVNGPAFSALGYVVRFPISTTTETFRYCDAYDHATASNASSASTVGNICVIKGSVTPSASGTLVARFSAESGGTITAKAALSTAEYW